jgi:hypothetical protein
VKWECCFLYKKEVWLHAVTKNPERGIIMKAKAVQRELDSRIHSFDGGDFVNQGNRVVRSLVDGEMIGPYYSQIDALNALRHYRQTGDVFPDRSGTIEGQIRRSELPRIHPHTKRLI